MIWTTIQVALGGAIGASLRFLATTSILRLVGPGFPYAVLSVNILGSFLMGVLFIVTAQKGITYMSPFLMTGILGGFTTFSAFSLDAFALFERGQAGTAAIYICASVLLSILGLFAGVMLARGVFA
ncbi:MAG: fluoride efflux transporter CrcB [Litoreibacter sp.]